MIVGFHMTPYFFGRAQVNVIFITTWQGQGHSLNSKNYCKNPHNHSQKFYWFVISLMPNDVIK